MIVFADIIRVINLVLSTVVFAIAIRVAWDHAYRNQPQMWRFLGLAFLCFSVSFGAYHALGHSPYWPVLIGNSVGVIFSLAGTVPLVAGKKT